MVEVAAGQVAGCLRQVSPDPFFTPPQGGAVEVPIELIEGPADVAELSATETAAAAAEVGPTTISVWFHVITDKGQGAVSDEQITAQLSVLNESFAGRTSATNGVASPFSFAHAGTTRTEAPQWFGADVFYAGSTAERDAKASLKQGDAKVLNVYVTETSGSSWARFPSWYRLSPTLDGIVLNWSHFVGNDASLGDVAVHEAGHWLGLYHTFQGYDFNTGLGGGCEGEGDYVADTPAEDVPAEGCPIFADTCPAPGTDPIHNFMDYSNDLCADHFTAGQVERMKAQWATYRLASTTRTKPGRGSTRK